MTAASKSSERHLTVSARHGAVLRRFIREAALAEDVPARVAGLPANDGLDIWNALRAIATGHEHARASLSLSQREVRSNASADVAPSNRHAMICWSRVRIGWV